MQHYLGDALLTL